MRMKTTLGSIALGAAMLVFGSGIANAQWFDNGCAARIARARNELYRAESIYGPYSWQANEERIELRRVMNYCGDDDYYGYAPRGFYFGGTFFLNHRHGDRDDHWRHHDNRWEHHDHDHGRHGDKRGRGHDDGHRR